jgi:hypothetical protein
LFIIINSVWLCDCDSHHDVELVQFGYSSFRIYAINPLRALSDNQTDFSQEHQPYETLPFICACHVKYINNSDMEINDLNELLQHHESGSLAATTPSNLQHLFNDLHGDVILEFIFDDSHRQYKEEFVSIIQRNRPLIPIITAVSKVAAVSNHNLTSVTQWILFVNRRMD